LSETDFIRNEQFRDALRKKGLLMDVSPDTIKTVGTIAEALIGNAPTAIMLQVDNGYMVVFRPAKNAAVIKLGAPRGFRHRGAPYPNPGIGGFVASPEDEQKIAEEEAERRRQVAVHGLRMKVRVRVYPALSQAIDEIKKFYEADGVVPGIDFEKMADEVMDEIGDGSVLGV